MEVAPQPASAFGRIGGHLPHQLLEVIGRRDGRKAEQGDGEGMRAMEHRRDGLIGLLTQGVRVLNQKGVRLVDRGVYRRSLVRRPEKAIGGTAGGHHHSPNGTVRRCRQYGEGRRGVGGEDRVRRMPLRSGNRRQVDDSTDVAAPDECGHRGRIAEPARLPQHGFGQARRARAAVGGEHRPSTAVEMSHHRGSEPAGRSRHKDPVTTHGPFPSPIIPFPVRCRSVFTQYLLDQENRLE